MTHPPYSFPAWKPKWRLISGFAGGEILLGTKSKHNCGKFNQRYNIRKLDSITPVLLRSEEDVFIQIKKQVDNRLCIVEGVFTPRSTLSYELSYRVGSKSCEIDILEVTFNGDRRSIQLRKAKSKDKKWICESSDSV